MELSLSKRTSPIEILAVDIEKGRVDFKWLDGRYEGVCSASAKIVLTVDQINSIAKQVAMNIDNEAKV